VHLAFLRLPEPQAYKLRSPGKGEDFMDNLHNKAPQDRSKIDMHEDYEVQYWTRELGLSKEQLQQIVDKVGNSAAAVRKELGMMGERHR
jgi:hypothetical protein